MLAIERRNEILDKQQKEKRVVVYSELEEMTEAGFTEDMPEYQAAQLYFSAEKNQVV